VHLRKFVQLSASLLRKDVQTLYVVQMRKQVRPHEADPDELIPTSEVAALARVDIATVNRWVKAGRLHAAVKSPGLRGANLYRRGDVAAFLAERASA
jgi:Helix-turn-helix domain